MIGLILFTIIFEFFVEGLEHKLHHGEHHVALHMLEKIFKVRYRKTRKHVAAHYRSSYQLYNPNTTLTGIDDFWVGQFRIADD